MKISKRMWITNKILLCIIISCLNILNLSAQDWAKTSIKYQHRVDLRHLGYPNINEIPEYNSAITSLITAKNGIIYGGTSGKEAFLFYFDPIANKVSHLGKIANQESIHHAMVQDSLGHLYIGTGKNMFNKIDLSPGGNWDAVDKVLWDDIKAYYRDYSGGHLYRYKPEESDDKIKLPDMHAEVEDLGIPVANNSIYALISSPDGSTVYGITYPDGHFFVYNISKHQFSDLGPIDEKIVFHGPERYWRSLSRALICDKQGNVYFSSTDGTLKYYSPHSERFHSTGLKIPGDYYPGQFFEHYTVVECFDQDQYGRIYGGTSDGYLFLFDPFKGELRNLGKPRADKRLRCLVVGDDKNIYFIAGETSLTSSVSSKLYKYDTENPGFVDYGMLIVDRSPYYYRQGRQFDSMTKGRDGTIYLGESEYRSSLFLLMPPFDNEN